MYTPSVTEIQLPHVFSVRETRNGNEAGGGRRGPAASPAPEAGWKGLLNDLGFERDALVFGP